MRRQGASTQDASLQDWMALLGCSSATFHLRPRDAWIDWTDGNE